MTASSPNGARAPRSSKAFETTCDCKIEWVALGDGVAMLNRLKLEGKNTKADVVLGLDTNLTAEAAATGSVRASMASMRAGETADRLDRSNTFMPYDYGYFAVVYDTQTMKTSAEEPR